MTEHEQGSTESTCGVSDYQTEKQIDPGSILCVEDDPLFRIANDHWTVGKWIPREIPLATFREWPFGAS